MFFLLVMCPWWICFHWILFFASKSLVGFIISGSDVPAFLVEYLCGWFLASYFRIFGRFNPYRALALIYIYMCVYIFEVDM